MPARERLLDAAVDVIRRQGLHATSVDQLCRQAGVTKGAFFHHFASKDELAAAAADHWGTTTGAMFAAAAYHDADDPLARILGYLDLRSTMHSDDPAEYTCLAGTMVQEAFHTSPTVRDACGEAIYGHARTLEDDLAQALAGLDPPPPGVTAASLARFTQTVLQGSFILAKAADDPAPLLEGIDHLRRYLVGLLDPDRLRTVAPPSSQPDPSPNQGAPS